MKTLFAIALMTLAITGCTQVDQVTAAIDHPPQHIAQELLDILKWAGQCVWAVVGPFLKMSVFGLLGI